jgi:hypothetical protein
MAILVALAEQFDGGLERQAVGAGDFKAKFSGVALRQQRKSEKEKAEVEQ